MPLREKSSAVSFQQKGEHKMPLREESSKHLRSSNFTESFKFHYFFAPILKTWFRIMARTVERVSEDEKIGLNHEGILE